LLNIEVSFIVTFWEPDDRSGFVLRLPEYRHWPVVPGRSGSVPAR
jgi:hypothetical protein